MRHDPAAPPTDARDWTWVIESACPECGFDPRSVRVDDLPGVLDTSARRWESVLNRPGVELRPRPDVWSPLEYAAHVRDVQELFAERVELMLRESGPTFPNWDQDAVAVQRRYWEADPGAVAENLRSNAQRFATLVEPLAAEQWSRSGARADGSEFTVETVSVYLVHELVHHLHDVNG